MDTSKLLAWPTTWALFLCCRKNGKCHLLTQSPLGPDGIARQHAAGGEHQRRDSNTWPCFMRDRFGPIAVDGTPSRKQPATKCQNRIAATEDSSDLRAPSPDESTPLLLSLNGRAGQSCTPRCPAQAIRCYKEAAVVTGDAGQYRSAAIAAGHPRRGPCRSAHRLSVLAA